MSDPFIGQIMQVGFNFAPVNWSTCAGQILPVAQNQALFTLLGATFGGNGSTNFGLPDAQGRTFVGVGQGAGLSNYVWGQKGGTENTTLTQQQMPAHTHVATVTPPSVNVQAVSGVATSPTNPASSPQAGSRLSNTFDNAAGGGLPQIYAPAGQGTPVNLGGVVVSGGGVTNAIAGGNIPFSNLQPYLAVTTIIALQGIYPTRG